jgi:hypothetical protein
MLGPRPVTRTDEKRSLTEVAPDSESGHGLVLVRALSKEWNYYVPPSGGKAVYCVIAV